MTALPDHAQSAQMLLQSFREDDGAASFDWQALARAVLPGHDTPTQRERLARIGRVREHLRAWAAAWHLPPTHEEASAVFASSITPLQMPDNVVMAFATLIFWIYTLDSHIDTHDLTALTGASPQRLLSEMDRDLAVACAPLQKALTSEELLQTNLDLPWHQMASPSPEVCLQLGAALAEWATALHSLWSGSSQQWRMRWRLIAHQLAWCVGQMRQGFIWDCQLHSDDTVPSLEAYLAAAQCSIGVYPICALAVTFEPRPFQRWCWTTRAISLGGRIVRLTNDLHTFATDQHEGNCTSVAIALSHLGYTPLAATPQQVKEAQAFLVPYLDAILAAFGREQQALVAGPLTYVIRHVVALSLAIYGRGERYRRAAPDHP